MSFVLILVLIALIVLGILFVVLFKFKGLKTALIVTAVFFVLLALSLIGLLFLIVRSM